MLPTALTWMFGLAFSNASMVAWIAATSLSALQPCQNVIVTSASGLSFAPPFDEPMQAVRASASAAVSGGAGDAATHESVSDHGALLVTGRALPGLARCRTVSKTSSRAAARAVWRAPASTGRSRTPASSRRGRVSGERAELVGDRAAEPLAAGGEHAAGEHDQGRVDDGDQAAMPSANRCAERREQLVAGAGRRRAPCATAACGGAWRGCPSDRARASTGRTAGQLLEAARVAAAYVAHQRGAGQRQEADLAGAAGGAAVEPAVDDDRRRRGPRPPTAGRSRRPRGARPDSQLGDGGEVHVVVDLGPGRRAASASRSSRSRVVPARAGGGRSAAAGCAGRRRRVCRWRAWCRSACAEAGRGGGAVEGVQHVAHRVGPGSPRGAQLVLADGAAGDVGDRGHDPGRA